VGDGPVRSTIPHGPQDGPVRSMGPHGTTLHGPVLDEGRISPPLDRTKVRHETSTSSTTVQSTVTDQSGINWTGRYISKL
jgi:hypothetical protein